MKGVLTLEIINRGSPESYRDMTLRVNDATKAYMITDKATLQKHEGKKMRLRKGRRETNMS